MPRRFNFSVSPAAKANFMSKRYYAGLKSSSPSRSRGLPANCTAEAGGFDRSHESSRNFVGASSAWREHPHSCWGRSALARRETLRH
jgi:hypothetical protein